MIIISCQKDYFYQAPPPHVAVQTTNLEAMYASKVPLSVTDKFWKEVDYLKVAVKNLNTDSLYGDGLLNMTGTLKGLTNFNNGKDPEVSVKAAYDDSKLYVYLQWTDPNLDPSFANSIFDGSADPNKPAEASAGWTSQGNTDRVALAFDIDGATGSGGTFADKGCAASCHNNSMKPQTGKVDVWNWSLAVSDPLGYACDMVSDAGTGLSNDAGQAMFVRNKVTAGNNRSAPAYEWDGTIQSVIRPDGKTVTLDPAYYLYNKLPYTGNAINGKAYYEGVADCIHCHGPNGVGGGEGGDGSTFADISFGRRYSRQGIKNFASSDIHEGNPNFNGVSNLQDDIIAYIKGLASVPGYYLTKPDGSSADIWAVSNVTKTKITTTPHTVYQVLLIRNLSTSNTDDIQFTSPAGKSYPFGIALMNRDGKNHIGSLKEILKFKSH